MKTAKVLSAAVFALLLAAACGSYGGATSQAYDIHGTVDSVDTNAHTLFLTNTSGYNNSLNPGGYPTTGNTVRVVYDNSTTVTYQGRAYRPEDLERGDEVTVHVNQSASQLIAQNINVTYDVRGGMASSSTGTYGYNTGQILHGTVRSIDTYRKTISVDPGYGPLVTIRYNTNTPVYYNGRSYAPADLQVGDQVDVRINNLGNNTLAANDITVSRSVSGTPMSSSSSSFTTMRGTVRYVDTTNHTIVLDNTSYVSGFQTNTASTLTISFDPSMNVSVNGQLYPISNLERGDIVDVQVGGLGSSNPFAQSVTLVRDVRGVVR